LLLPPNEFGPMLIEDGQQLLVVNVPQGPPGLVLAQEAQVSQQLAEPDIGGQFA
jgi:hypothetical protein